MKSTNIIYAVNFVYHSDRECNYIKSTSGAEYFDSFEEAKEYYENAVYSQGCWHEHGDYIGIELTKVDADGDEFGEIISNWNYAKDEMVPYCEYEGTLEDILKIYSCETLRMTDIVANGDVIARGEEIAELYKEHLNLKKRYYVYDTKADYYEYQLFEKDPDYGIELEYWM